MCIPVWMNKLDKLGIGFLKKTYIWIMIEREASMRIKYLAGRFKAIALTGPRQSGKTTLVQSLFPDKPYVTLENPARREFAERDPENFLGGFPRGAILDEAQRVPHLFSYLQEILDNSKRKGMFVLTGSNNFLLNAAISQSLAGRIAYMTLLPFSMSELASAGKLPDKDDDLMLKGFYPPVYSQRIKPQDWCPEYIRTYVERDVRQLKNVSNLNLFEKVLALLAGRCGQELNLSAIANEAGVDYKTVQAWIGILESSFVVYLLRPHFRNFNKTILKRPKIYFYDTALVCSLLRITNKDHLNTHPSRGHIFENMVVIELLKKRTNAGKPIDLYYWRDKTGHEVDVIVDEGQKLFPIEIKSGQTIASDYFDNMEYWMKLSKTKSGALLYAGDQMQKRSNGITVSNWRTAIKNL